MNSPKEQDIEQDQASCGRGVVTLTVPENTGKPGIPGKLYLTVADLPVLAYAIHYLIAYQHDPKSVG